MQFNGILTNLMTVEKLSLLCCIHQQVENELKNYKKDMEFAVKHTL